MKEPELFRYIKSLSKADKRFFRIFSDAVGGKSEKSYLELFQVLEPMSVYDESQLESALADKSFVGHLSTTRNRLFEALLRSQRVLKSGRSVESAIRSAMDDLELLVEADLYRSGARRLDKAIQMGHQYEKYGLLLELYRWKWRFLQKAEPSQQIKLGEELSQDEEELFSRLHLQKEMHRLYEHSRLLARRQPRARNPEVVQQYDQLLQHDCIQQSATGDQFLVPAYQLMVRGTHALGTGDFSLASDHYRQVIQLWDKHPHQITEHPQLFLQSHNDYLTSLLFSGKNLDEFLAAVKKLKRLSGLPRQTKANLEWIGYNQSLILSMNFRPQKETIDLINEIRPWLHGNRNVLADRHQLGFFYNFAVFFFCRGEWSQANFWVNQILNHRQGSERQDIRDFARIIQVLLQHELQNFDLNEYLVRSTYRYMSRNKRYHALEKAVLDYIRRSAQFPAGPQQKKTLVNLLRSLENLQQEYGPKALLGLQEITIWTHAKLAGVSMQEMLNQLLAQNREEVGED